MSGPDDRVRAPSRRKRGRKPSQPTMTRCSIVDEGGGPLVAPKAEPTAARHHKAPTKKDSHKHHGSHHPETQHTFPPTERNPRGRRKKSQTSISIPGSDDQPQILPNLTRGPTSDKSSQGGLEDHVTGCGKSVHEEEPDGCRVEPLGMTADAASGSVRPDATEAEAQAIPERITITATTQLRRLSSASPKVDSGVRSEGNDLVSTPPPQQVKFQVGTPPRPQMEEDGPEPGAIPPGTVERSPINAVNRRISHTSSPTGHSSGWRKTRAPNMTEGADKWNASVITAGRAVTVDEAIAMVIAERARAKTEVTETEIKPGERQTRGSRAILFTKAITSMPGVNLVATAAVSVSTKIARAAEEEESAQSNLHYMRDPFLALSVAILVALILGALVGISMYIRGRRADAGQITCRTPECYAARKYLEDLLNDTADKCSDFYGHVCEHWQQREEVSSFASDQEDALILRLHDRLTAETRLDHRSTSLLYRACMNYVSGADVSETPGGHDVAVMSAHMRRAKSFDAVFGVLARVSLQLGLHAVLEIRVVTAGDDRPMLHLSPGRSVLTKMGLRDHPEELRSVLRTAFAWLPGVYTEEIISAVVESDATIRPYLEPETTRATIFSLPDDKAINTLKHFVYALVPGVYPTDWSEALLRALHPNITHAVNVTVRANISATRAADFIHALQNLSSSGLERTKMYLAASLDAEVAFLETSRARLASARTSEKARFCLDLCQRNMPLSWRLVIRGYLPQDAEQAEYVIHDMFKVIVETIKSDAILSWLPKQSREQLLLRVHHTHVALVRQKASRHAFLESSQVDIQPDNASAFVHDYLDVVKENHEQSLRSPPRLQDLTLGRLEPLGTVSYVRSLGEVLVPSLYLAEPYLYSRGVPIYFNYGTVGVLLGAAIVQLVAEGGGNAGTSSSALPPWWTADSRRRRDKYLQCLDDLRRRMGLPDTVNGRDHVGAYDLFALAQGVRIAYQALHARFSQYAASPDVFDRYWQTAQRTFLLRSCLLWCGGDRKKGPLAAKQLCTVPLQNMPEFSEAFHCHGTPQFTRGDCEM